MFLRFFDDTFHDKTANHDSRRCCVPSDWMLFGAVGSDDNLPQFQPGRAGNSTLAGKAYLWIGRCFRQSLDRQKSAPNAPVLDAGIRFH